MLAGTPFARDKYAGHGNRGKAVLLRTTNSLHKLALHHRRGLHCPRKNEIRSLTMEAKKSFALETSDISALTGLRHQQSGYRSGSTLTMYYHDDLVVLCEKGGKPTSMRKCPRTQASGAEAREQAARDQQAAINQVINDPYSVVPASRLSDFGIHRLQAMVQRLEGGKKPPWPASKEAAVSRIIAAGYSEASEAAHMAQQRVADEAERARLEAERAARIAAQQKTEAEEAVKKAARDAAAEARKAAREKAFAAGELQVEDLNYQEMHKQLMELAGAGFDKGYATGKERAGLKKAAMLEILKANLEEMRKRGRSSLEALAEANLAEAKLAENTSAEGGTERHAECGAESEPSTKKPQMEAGAAQTAALPAVEQEAASSSSPSAISAASASSAATTTSMAATTSSSAAITSSMAATSSSTATAAVTATTAVPSMSVKPAGRNVAHTPLTSSGQGAVSKVFQSDIRNFFGNK